MFHTSARCQQLLCRIDAQPDAKLLAQHIPKLISAWNGTCSAAEAISMYDLCVLRDRSAISVQLTAQRISELDSKM
jgi:hypothetical protein